MSALHPLVSTCRFRLTFRLTFTPSDEASVLRVKHRPNSADTSHYNHRRLGYYHAPQALVLIGALLFLRRPISKSVLIQFVIMLTLLRSRAAGCSPCAAVIIQLLLQLGGGRPTNGA